MATPRQNLFVQTVTITDLTCYNGAKPSSEMDTVAPANWCQVFRLKIYRAAFKWPFRPCGRVRALKTSNAATVGTVAAIVDFVSRRYVSASIPFAN